WMRMGSPVEVCVVRALEAARHIRALVQAMPLAERGRRADAALKPGLALTLEVDRVAEQAAIAALERLAAEIGHRVHLIVDPGRGHVIPLGRSTHRHIVF